MSKIKTASLHTKEGDAVLLEGIKISGDVRGLLFDAVITQTYKNNTQDAAEVIYNFPLPFGAVLLGVEVVLGKVILKGQVVEKSKAIDGYEELVSNGDTAILIERTKDHNYCMNLGNLGAGEKCTIELRYGQVLRYEQGRLRIQIPTVLAPRYGDAISDEQFEPQQEYSNDLMASYDFELSIRLHDPLTQGKISSPSHAISIYHYLQNAESNTTAYVDIGLGRSYALDRDFVLIIDKIQQESLAVQSPDYVDKNQNVALISFNPILDSRNVQTVAQALSIKILVDCSGSMAGDSINSVGDALGFLINELKPNDHFSLSRFGHDVEHRSRGMWRVGDASINAARQWVGDLQANMGGTELGRALESTIERASNTPSDILLITDGEIHAIDSVIETAKFGKQRIYVVGIGSSPVESHLRRLAKATEGACEFIAPGEDVKPAIIKMFNRIRFPAYRDVRVIWPDGTDIEYQTHIDAVCNGDTVNVFAWMKARLEGEVSLVGQLDGTEEIVLAKAKIPTVLDCDAISRIGVSERLNAENIEESELAVAYQLIRSKTSMLLEQIRQSDQKQKDMPALFKIAQMVPAGWGGTGSVQDIVRYMRRPPPSQIEFSKKAPEASGALTKVEIKDFAKKIRESLEIQKKERRQNDEVRHSKAEALKNFLESYKPDQINAQKESHKPKRKIKMTDRNNPLLWSNANDYHALTPMGMVEWLRVNDGLYKVDNFELLDLIGVPAEVIDWIDLQLIVNDGEPIGEQDVTQVFIAIMRTPVTLGYLEGRIDYDEWEQEVIKGFTNREINEHSIQSILRMAKVFVQHLKGMSVIRWFDLKNTPSTSN